MPRSRVSYLSQLRFEPKLLNSFSAKYLRNVRLPILLIISIIILGIFAFVSIPRRLNPEIKIAIVIVNTTLPGAGPEDVESLVTIPIERKIGGVEGIDTMNSISRESNSTISLQFLSTVNGNDALNDVEKAVNSVNNLPNDANTPDVRLLDFENQPFWTFAITSKTDTASLMRFADDLKKKIEDVSQVDHVMTSGLDNQTIEVIVDLKKAKDYNLDPLTISQLVKSAAKSLPAGNVNSSSSSFSLTINREIISLEDIRNLTIQTGNTSVRLGDIATVAERSKSGQQNTYLATKNSSAGRAVQFFVFKKKAANIDRAFQVTEPVVTSELKKYNGRFKLSTIENAAELINKQFNSLYREFSNTIILVFILLFIFLGLRQGIISNITVPLTFLSSLAVINAFGLTLNFLTVFSFLLTLGILIDDTIVVVAAMTRYHKTGKFTPYQTAIMVWHDFIIPLWSSAITTIWGFVPLLLSTGIIGEFIKSIPIVVTTAMLSSTLISVLITIPLMIIFLKPKFPKRVKVLFVILGIIAYVLLLVLVLPRNVLMPIAIVVGLLLLFIAYRVRKSLIAGYKYFMKTNKRARVWWKRIKDVSDHGLINIEKLSERYRSVIEQILSSAQARRRTLIAIGCFTVFAYLLLPLGLVKNEFFPKDDAELIYANVELPPGTNSDAINKEAVRLIAPLSKTEDLDYLVTEIGTSFNTSGDRDISPNTILFTLHLIDKNDRIPTSSDIAEHLRSRFADYTKGKFSVVELSGGPPAGADVQIKILGEDSGVLEQYADKLVVYLKKQPGLVNVDKSIKPGTSKIVFMPDKNQLAQAGISLDQLGLWLRTYASGFTLDSVLFGDKEKDITFRTNSYDQQSLDELSSIEIPLRTGATVPLASLGRFKLETNPSTITRENQKRTISVFAGVTQGVNIPEKNAELLKYANSLKLPSGYEFATGGVNEENQRSVTSILRAMIISFMLIAVTMVIEFRSFRQAFIAMLMIPISISGVFYIFALVRTPLSFAALIGVLALFGIVMRHAIVVLEKINENREQGLNLHDSIADAAASRLEPVLLTSLATIVALIPITVEDPFWRGLGGAIIAGLLFTGVLKLFFVPVLYYDFYKGEEKVNRSSARRKF